MQDPTVALASRGDYDRSLAALVAAFICDPFVRWMFPDSRQYLHYFPLVLKYFASRAFERTTAYRLDDTSVNNLRFIGALACGTQLLLMATGSLAQTRPASAGGRCGEVMMIQTHDNSTTRYAFVPPPGPERQGSPITLVLLPGGSGHVNLDDNGCPRALRGNSLIQSIPIFNAAGLGTALVDAPSDLCG